MTEKTWSGRLPRAWLVLSGNELLDGRTRDRNGAMASAELSALGVKVVGVTLVADEAAALELALRRALADAPDLLLVGGGLGTTHDDLTAECLARVLGVGLAEHPQALAQLRERIEVLAARRVIPFERAFAQARRQALLPAGADPVPPAGVAPGIAARSGPTRIYALPGVPWEFASMWHGIAARLAEEGLFPDHTGLTVRVFGVGEPAVIPVLESLPLERLEVGVNVGFGELTVRLRHLREPEAEAQAVALVAALQAAVPVFSADGRTVDDLVADGLRAAGSTVAVAESCTGGLLGARFTARPGSSDYFVGGVIAYANEVKAGLLDVPPGMLAQYGAVSEEVAGAMAEGVRGATGAGYGLSVTGVAGPDGGTAEKPVGLVYLGCAAPGGTRVVRGQFPGDRDSVREWSVTRALHLLREALAS